MKRIAVTGATGLIGRHLVAALRARGDSVVALSRHAQQVADLDTTVWDPSGEALPASARDDVDAIVNLAGTGIGDGRWSPTHRRQIIDSRVDTTRRVVTALGDGGPTTLINASAVGFYGPSDDALDEDAPAGHDFLAEVCTSWEQEAQLGADRARVVRLRTGVVLATDGGALPRLLLPTRLGLGGPLGGGHQWMSWIHIEDQINAILHCLEDSTIAGAVNATAPHAVRQREFARVLGRVLHRPAFLPTPGFPARLLLGAAADIALTGQQVVPGVLTKTGFAFRFTDLEPALRDLLTDGH